MLGKFDKKVNSITEERVKVFKVHRQLWQNFPSEKARQFYGDFMSRKQQTDPTFRSSLRKTRDPKGYKSMVGSRISEWKLWLGSPRLLQCTLRHFWDGLLSVEWAQMLDIAREEPKWWGKQVKISKIKIIRRPTASYMNWLFWLSRLVRTVRWGIYLILPL